MRGATLETPCFTADRVAAPGFIYTSRVPSYIQNEREASARLVRARINSPRKLSRAARIYGGSEQPFDSDN